MRRLLALLLAAVLIGTLTQMPAANAAPTAAVTVQTPPLLRGDSTGGAATALACPCIGWSVYFGRLNGVHPVVNSNRNPTWDVVASPFHLRFQPDCNLVDQDTSPVWASNSVAGLRPCVLDFQLNLDIQIRNAASQLGWHTGIIHTGNTYGALALYNNGCVVEYYWNAGTSQWLNQWRNQPNYLPAGACATLTG
jgi:hypothetical protein